MFNTLACCGTCDVMHSMLQDSVTKVVALPRSRCNHKHRCSSAAQVDGSICSPLTLGFLVRFIGDRFIVVSGDITKSVLDLIVICTVYD